MSIKRLDDLRAQAQYARQRSLPLEASPGSGYFHSERIEGSKHFGAWPRREAAQARFGTPHWPVDRTVPQMSLELEVHDADAVESAAEELRRRGFTLLLTRARSRGARRWLGFNHKGARSSGSRSLPLCTIDGLRTAVVAMESHERWPLVSAPAPRNGGEGAPKGPGGGVPAAGLDP